MTDKKKPRLFLWFSVLIVGLIATYIIFNANGFFRHSELKQQIKDLGMELDTLRRQNKGLRDQIDSLQKQYDAKIEQVAREKHNMKKENEKVIKIEKK